MIGCDGARSWTRNTLGFELQGESIDVVWGVMDIVPFTDFREFPIPPYFPRFYHRRMITGND